jgi:hypothetical protein
MRISERQHHRDFQFRTKPGSSKSWTNSWLSKEGQKAVVKGWTHSERGDIAPPKGAPERKSFLAKGDLKPNWEKLAKEREKTKADFRKNHGREITSTRNPLKAGFLALAENPTSFF